MGLFKKGKSRDEVIAEGIAASEAEAAAASDKGDEGFKSGDPKIDIEIAKIHAQLEAMAEVRKSNSERFSRTSEQLGELRGMIVDTNKAMSKVEVAATKATDLVESVHPEKLMIEVRKQDGKIEALRAAIESNEAIMKDLMNEVKAMRDKMSFYKGTEQVIQLNEEVKQELANIKKMEAIVERHADKVETIFVEVEKKFTNFEKYDDNVKEIQEGFRKVNNEFEKLRAKVATKEDKKEFVDLLDKFNDFEKHTTNLLKLLDDRSKLVKNELVQEFNKLRDGLIAEAKKGQIDKAAKELIKREADSGPAEQSAEGAKEALPAGEEKAAAELDALQKNLDRKVGWDAPAEQSAEQAVQPAEAPAEQTAQSASDDAIEVADPNVTIEAKDEEKAAAKPAEEREGRVSRFIGRFNRK